MAADLVSIFYLLICPFVAVNHITFRKISITIVHSKILASIEQLLWALTSNSPQDVRKSIPNHALENSYSPSCLQWSILSKTVPFHGKFSIDLCKLLFLSSNRAFIKYSLVLQAMMTVSYERILFKNNLQSSIDKINKEYSSICLFIIVNLLWFCFWQRYVFIVTNHAEYV